MISEKTYICPFHEIPLEETKFQTLKCPSCSYEIVQLKHVECKHNWILEGNNFICRLCHTTKNHTHD